GKGVYYGAARSEAGATNGMDLHLIGAGNSAGQAALNFANHARSVTILPIAPLIARAIHAVFNDGSVTSMFDGAA
ncbi:MAG TPA: hypothetical protein VGP10_04420, partial [Marisediminicola sp.]|nr:hypothetical protein [Marisediminicola sp.]